MCGISGIIGNYWDIAQLRAMIASQRHRGPDNNDLYCDESGIAGLGHNRLSIIDLSDAGRQPMTDPFGRYSIVFNGEIYNYLELHDELQSSYDFRTRTDSEVLLAAYCKWGESCLDRLIGMFAFAIWDSKERTLFAARDRFGVKPFYYATLSDNLIFASEIKALHAAGLSARPDPVNWARYLGYGIHDHSEQTFWEGVRALPPGSVLKWRDGQTQTSLWYDLSQRVAETYDQRDLATVENEYLSLLTHSVMLRFRSDVPVGINLSGGLDSSILLGLVHKVQGADSNVKAFTFSTGDDRYDELPWVRQMLQRTRHELVDCRVTPEEIPDLAESVQRHQDEPFGGLPTLAYARLFEQARKMGVIVLLDGQGMDEQWAGYDYYRDASSDRATAIVQGTTTSPVRPECLTPEFKSLATRFEAPAVFSDRLRNLQYRDARYTKIPRALRFNDRVSMRSSNELREPFLDHRLFELAMSQPIERKINNGTSKRLLRRIARKIVPAGVGEAPKRPLQTPQREWLRGPLRQWANDAIEAGLERYGDQWLDSAKIRSAWKDYCAGNSDNSFHIWQWISVGLLAKSCTATVGSATASVEPHIVTERASVS